MSVWNTEVTRRLNKQRYWTDPRDLMWSVKRVIDALEDEYDKGVPFDELADIMDQKGVDEDTVVETLDKLQTKGDVVETKTNHVAIAGEVWDPDDLSDEDRGEWRSLRDRADELSGGVAR